jgi:hypothetical protein
MVYPQKKSMMIKVSIIFLATLIVFSMATVVIAQSKVVPLRPLTTPQEDRILEIGNRASTEKNNIQSTEDFLKEYTRYVRDGCKKVLAGYWYWDKWNDVIKITYHEGEKVFLGNVTIPRKMDFKPNHLLFKVYFPKDDDPDYRYFAADEKTVPSKIDIHWLREQRQCKFMWFTGTEFSFDQTTKKKTEEKLILVLNGNQLQYKLDKKAWNLFRGNVGVQR